MIEASAAAVGDASAAAARDMSRRDPGHASLAAVDDASRGDRRNASPRSTHDASTPDPRDVLSVDGRVASLAEPHDASRPGKTRRVCTWCARPIPDGKRRDSLACSKVCRQASHRARVRRLDLAADGRSMRLAYADPPYPGNAHRYRGHPDYAGEVDHRELIARLATYDGWALSTSAAALPMVLAECVAQDLTVRVASWHRGPRPHLETRVLSAWEPVVFSGARRLTGPIVADTISVVPRRRPTLPTSILGMKPPAFCEWMFGLIGALPGDELDDLFPGSGIVGRCWAQYTSTDVVRDASLGPQNDASRRAAAGGCAR